jgi:hypothetical protein
MKGVYIQTYGCQMNVSDSDRMEAILAGLNYDYRNGIALGGFPPSLTMHATPDIHDITDMM